VADLGAICASSGFAASVLESWLSAVKLPALRNRVGNMTTTDPIADMLTRIRNATMARHEFVLLPLSSTKLSIAKLLREEGFIDNYEVIKSKPARMVKIRLKYMDNKQPAISGLKRVSRPGLRVYVQRSEIPRIYGGLGIAILSTDKGLMTGQRAWKQRLGGELLCYVW